MKLLRIIQGGRKQLFPAFVLPYYLDVLDLWVTRLIIVCGGTAVERVPILEPGGPNLLLCLSLVIGWREQGHGSFDLHQHDTADGAHGSALPIECEPLLKDGSLLVNGRRAFEAIALAAHWINDVD